MNSNIAPSDRVALAGVIDPDNYAPGAYTTGWVPMADFAAVLAVLKVGDMAAGATVDAKLEQARDDAGTGSKDVTGKAITQLTQAGGDGNEQVLINCRADELDINGNYTHVRLSVTVGTAAVDLDGEVLGLDARYQPAAQPATVTEVVS